MCRYLCLYMKNQLLVLEICAFEIFEMFFYKHKKQENMLKRQPFSKGKSRLLSYITYTVLLIKNAKFPG